RADDESDLRPAAAVSGLQGESGAPETRRHLAVAVGRPGRVRPRLGRDRGRHVPLPDPEGDVRTGRVPAGPSRLHESAHGRRLSCSRSSNRASRPASKTSTGGPDTIRRGFLLPGPRMASAWAWGLSWSGRAGARPGSRARAAVPPAGLEGRRLEPSRIPQFGAHTDLRVVIGVESYVYTERGIKTLLSTDWQVSSKIDRVGYRYLGPQLECVTRTRPFGAGSDPTN